VNLEELKKHWNRFGDDDPLWAVLSDDAKRGGRWDVEEFFRTGREQLCCALGHAVALPVPTRLTRYLEELVRSTEGGTEKPGQLHEQALTDHFFNLFMSKDPEPRARKGKALDFGCGVGRITRALSSFFEEVHGVDIAPSMVEQARRLAGPDSGCTFYVNDSQDLGLFETGAFDFVFSVLVLQHMEPVYSMRYVRELVRVLSTGGILCFQLPSEPAIPPPRPSQGLTTIDHPLPDAGFRAELTVLDSPDLTFEPGAELSIKVRVKNNSECGWPALGQAGFKYQIQLGNHWLSAAGKLLTRDDVRVPLPKDLAPGEDVVLELKTTVRQRHGDYFLELDMVQEEVAWFAERGSRTIRIPVRVVLHAGSDEFVPAMDMFGVPQEEVISHIESSGGRLLRLEESYYLGWRYLQYYATK
jgi:SAM-dependent methyltransferase